MVLQVLLDPTKRFFDQAVIPPSYVISKIGNKYYAKNGETGEIEFSGTDAATVIQSAIDAVEAQGGGKVFLKQGTYILNSQINLCSNLVLEGEGRATVLKLKDGANFNALQANGKQKIVVRNVSVDGNRDNIDTGAPIYSTLNCVRILDCEDVVVEGCHLFDPYYFGVRVEGTTSRRICVRGNYVHGFRDQGISFQDATGGVIAGNIVYNGPDAGYTGGFIGINVWKAKRVSVVSNVVHNVGPANGFGHGIGCEDSEHVVIASNVCYLNDRLGVYINQWDTLKPKHITVIGNVCYDNYRGISAENSEHVTIVGNECRLNYQGIHAKSVVPLLIENNHSVENDDIQIFVEGVNVAEGIVANNYVEGGVSNGIDLRDCKKFVVANNLVKNVNGSAIYFENTTYSLVVGNKCFDDRVTKDQDYGFKEIGTSDYNYVIDNDFRDNISAVTLVGVNTVCKRNLGYTTESSGVLTASGDGVATEFDISSHGLAENPTDPSRIYAEATPVSSDAQVASPCEAYPADLDADGLYEALRVKFTSAPVAGTNNVKVRWKAELY